MSLFTRALMAFDRALGGMIGASRTLGALWVFAMMLAVVTDVIGRYLFNAPIKGTTEMVTLSVVAVLYLEISSTLRSGGMTRSDAFYGKLLARHSRIGSALGLLYDAAGACLAGAIMVRAWPRWLEAWRSDYYIGIIDVFTFPEWPLLLIIFLGCGLTGLQFLVFATDHVIRICGVPARNLGPR